MDLGEVSTKVGCKVPLLKQLQWLLEVQRFELSVNEDGLSSKTVSTNEKGRTMRKN